MQSTQAAVEHAECPICFEELHSAPSGVFVDANRRRVSQHFFNYNAATKWLQEKKSCPITRNPAAAVMLVPDIRRDPRGWFKVVDMDGDGKLSRKEVVEVLKAQLPIDYRRLEQEALKGDLWRMWDTNGNGFLEEQELLGDQGLVNYVASVFQQGSPQSAPPDIKTNRIAWFQHFDEDYSGSLEQGEVVRALIKTLHLSSQQMDAVCECIEAIWPIFDTDGSGSIERDEFLLPCNGLADTIIAQLGISA